MIKVKTVNIGIVFFLSFLCMFIQLLGILVFLCLFSVRVCLCLCLPYVYVTMCTFIFFPRASLRKSFFTSLNSSALRCCPGRFRSRRCRSVASSYCRSKQGDIARECPKENAARPTQRCVASWGFEKMSVVCLCVCLSVAPRA